MYANEKTENHQSFSVNFPFFEILNTVKFNLPLRFKHSKQILF